MHYGQLNISKTSKDVYQSIHSLAYDSRKTQMEVWKDNGHSGNHLSLKFNFYKFHRVLIHSIHNQHNVIF